MTEARERVVDRLRQGQMEWAVLRPTGFFNDLDMARRGRVWLIGSGEERINPIHGADLAAACVGCFTSDETSGEHDVGGPDVLSQRQIGELAFATWERTPRFGRVPAGLLDGMATLTSPFNANLSTFLRMFALLGRGDVVAPARGSHHLAHHFQARAASPSGA